MPALLVVLLLVLAALQYRWIAQLSEAERQHVVRSVERGAAALADGLDHEVTLAFLTFRIGEPRGGASLGPLLAERLRRWQTIAAEPALIRDIHVIRRGQDGATLLRLDPASGSLAPAEWDPGLDAVRRRLRDPTRIPVVDGRLPGLVVAIHQPPEDHRPPGRRHPPRDHVVVRFDLELVTTAMLPRLVETHLDEEVGIPLSVRVVEVDRPEHVVFRTGPVPASAEGRPDATVDLLGLRSFPDLGDRRGGMPAGPHVSDGQLAAEPAPPGQRGRWVLEVRHPAGTLEAAVAAARRRNVAVSSAVLALLAAAGVLTVVSSRRAQRLARQQLDFVASVTHELRTPLTAIRSAGQNLAAGIIDEPERVRSYGQLIEREGRRLTDMVGRVLTFAGIRSGRQSFRMAPVPVTEIVDAVLEDCRWVLDEKGLEVEVRVPDGLPPIQGDAAALRQALANLVDNAIKYGVDGRWVGISAGAADGRDEVTIAVSDRGPGIPRAELPHLFEPFCRGAAATRGTVPGSGLGLAVVRGIVEAHGGRVEASSRPGHGSTFTVHLPATGVGSSAESGG